MVYQQNTRRLALVTRFQPLQEGQVRWPSTWGIVCYVRDTIPTKQWTELNQPELENMWMTIRPPKMPRNHPQITICTVYQPPGADDWTLLNHIDQSVDYVRRHHPYTGVIIMGDHNKLRYSHLKKNHNLKQIVDIPTRGTATLDKIYTNQLIYTTIQ